MKMFDKKTVCATCLSQDRKLYKVGTLRVFLKLYSTLSPAQTDKVCWECKYTAQKIVIFLERAQKAQAWLRNKLNRQLSDIPCFSTLCTTTISDTELTSSDATVPEPLLVAVKQDVDDTSDNRSQCSYKDNYDNETTVKIETEIPVITINKVELPDTTVHNTSSNTVHNIELPAVPDTPSNLLHNVPTFLPNVMHYAELPNNVTHNIGLPAPEMHNIGFATPGMHSMDIPIMHIMPLPNNIMHNVGLPTNIVHNMGPPNTMWHNKGFPNNIFNTGLPNNMMYDTANIMYNGHNGGLPNHIMHNISQTTKAMRNVRLPNRMRNTEQHNNIMHTVQPPTNPMHNIGLPGPEMHHVTVPASNMHYNKYNNITRPATEMHNIPVPTTGMHNIMRPTNVMHNKEPPTNMPASVDVPANEMLEFEIPLTEEHNTGVLEKIKQEEITGPTEPDFIYTEEPLTEQGLIEWREKKRTLYNFAKCLPAYRCESCVDSFEKPSSVARHAKKHTEIYGEFECDICKQRALDKEGLEKHRKLHYRILKCRYCEFVWDDANGMRKHCIDQHWIEQTVWHCGPCELQFLSLRKFRNHERRHRRVRCSECDKWLPQNMLSDHMSVHRGKPPKKHERQECHKCGKTFTRLSQHMLTHNIEADPAAVCVPCDRQFRDAATLRNHLRYSMKHAAESDFQYKCDICKRNFAKASGLERHQSILHNGQVYSCEKCDQTFPSKVKRYAHMQKHALAPLPKNKYCDYCGKGFTSKIILSQHINTHTGARPFVCKLCGADFGHQSALYLHGRYKHKIKGKDGKEFLRKKKVGAKDTKKGVENDKLITTENDCGDNRVTKRSEGERVVNSELDSENDIKDAIDSDDSDDGVGKLLQIRRTKRKLSYLDDDKDDENDAKGKVLNRKKGKRKKNIDLES